MPTGSNIIEVDDILRKYSLEDLLRAADDYFARIQDRSYHLAKPFASADETPTLVGHFNAVVSALSLAPADRVLDFGCGSGWSTRLFAQMGCEVEGVDVSPAALDIARELLESLPLVGRATAPGFHVFDGHELPFADGSFDRIACIDAFHHVPNQADVLAEFLRVLRPGGLVALAEPGPGHSRTAQSQSEMRNFVVVERDIVIEDIARLATEIGFETVLTGVYNPLPHLVPVERFDAAISGQDGDVLRAAQAFHENHRLIVLGAPGERSRDSRRREGLAVELHVAPAGERWRVRGVNTGVRWLPSGPTVGAVNLGIHLYDREGRLLDLDFHRVSVSSDPVESGTEFDVVVELPPLPPSGHGLVFDMVAEGVTWFEDVGNSPVFVTIDEAVGP